MSNERVVNAALAGGINQEVDQFLVKPPEMLTLENASVVKPGRLEKRNGFDLVVSTPGTPATAFDGDTVPSPFVEAMSPYYGADGDRMLLASGNTLYEHVGSDSTHGWRTVNKLPSYVGSLAGVTSSGGSIIEVETLEDSTGTYRLTVWVSGQRTGQERTSDLVYSSQTAGSGNAIYYAVQLIENSSFVKPPTLLVSSIDVSSPVYNLRLTKLNIAAPPTAQWDAFVSWEESYTLKVGCSVIDMQTGSATATQYPITIGQTCHRAFDVVGLSYGVAPSSVLFVYGEADTASNTNPAKLPGKVFSVNATSGVCTLTASRTDMISHSAPSGGVAWYNPWAMRGVVLDQADDGASGYVSFAARTVSSYYSDTVSNTYQLDGNIVIGQAIVLSSGATLNRGTSQVYIPQIGFQTQDSHTAVFAQAAGPYYRTGSVNQFASGSVALAITYTTGTHTTAITLTGTVGVTNNVQQYSVSVAGNSYTVNGPYAAQDQSNIYASGSYPIQTHVYPSGSSTQPTIPGDQTNWISWNATTGGTFATGYYPGSYVFGPTVSAGAIVAGNRYRISSVGSTNFTLIGASSNTVGTVFVATASGTGSGTANVQLAQATAYVDAAGHIVELAIEDGRTVYAYATTNSSASVTHVVGPTVTSGSPVLSAGTCYTIKPSSGVAVSFVDIPAVGVYTSNPTYKAVYGFEHCVHRWAVKASSSYVALALSSTSANTVTTPNGQEPYGAADPHNVNNFFEVYKWNPASSSGTSALVTSGSPVGCLIGALGGPWRLISGIQLLDGGVTSLGCLITPSGDHAQRSTYLVRIGSYDDTVEIQYPSTESVGPPSDYTYADNPGMYVESANMMRVTSIPLNTPSISKTTDANGLLCVGLRDGATPGTQQIFSLNYDGNATSWRKMQNINDYTIVNGGVPSSFDGVGCNELTSLLWPQNDFTSINWAKYPDVYRVDEQFSIYNQSYSSMPCAFFNYYADTGSGYFGDPSFLLVNITRPYFKYEAGFNNKNGSFENSVASIYAYDLPVGNAWGTIYTTFGGEPSKNYETVYSDPRITQFNTVQQTTVYVSGWSQGGSEQQHYYGRYQNNPADYGTVGSNSQSMYIGAATSPLRLKYSLWVWAPRSAKGWGGTTISNTHFSRKSVYDQADSGGDFLIRWTYEYVDGTGRSSRSAASVATKYTICSQVFGGFVQYEGDSPSYAGGLVSVFRYGFFAPRLELTNRLAVSADDPRRVVLQPYTTAEPYSTVLYRMPFSSFYNDVSDFVVDRNVTRGVVPYTSNAFDGSSGTTTYPLGLVTSNLSAFDGPLKDYNGVLTQPYLYTTGNVLDNVAPPSCKAMCVHQNRLFLGGADDEAVVWFSKEISPTDAPGFNDQLTLNISEGGPVTGLASLGDSLVVFKKNDVFIVSGTFPDSTGVSTSLGTPYALPSGLGCVDHRSVIETPLGVFFRSTRSIELLKPNFEIFQIGDKVQNYLNADEQVVSVAHNAKSQEVYFTMSDGKILVYSYKLNGWYTWTAPDVSSLSSPRAAVLGNTLWYSVPSDDDWNASHTAQAFTYKQNSLYVDQLRGTGSYTPSFYSLRWTMGPFTMNEQQGHQRVKRIRIFSWVDGPATIGLPGAQMLIGTDGGINGINDLVQTVTFTESQVKSIQTSQGFIQLETHCANQKGQLQLVGFTETAPAVVDDQCRNLFMSNIAVVVGLKTGLNKRITEQAKH